MMTTFVIEEISIEWKLINYDKKFNGFFRAPTLFLGVGRW
jgi:hypothetical protein